MSAHASKQRAAVDALCRVIVDDWETAASCFYCYRDKNQKPIQGRTVRFAELAAYFWGGIESESQPVAVGPARTRVRTICKDVERNLTATVEIETSVEDGEIIKASQLASAVGYRTALFRVIPSLLFESAFKKAVHVATGGGRSIKKRRSWVLNRLIKIHPDLTKADLLQSVGRAEVQELTLTDLAVLIGQSNSDDIKAARQSSLSPSDFRKSQKHGQIQES